MNECQAQCATQSAATRSVAQRAHATQARHAHKHNSARATEHSPHYVFTLCTALICVLSRAVFVSSCTPRTTFLWSAISAFPVQWLLAFPCAVLLVRYWSLWSVSRRTSPGTAVESYLLKSKAFTCALTRAMNSRAPVQEQSRTVRPILSAFLGSATAVVCQATHARLLPC